MALPAVVVAAMKYKKLAMYAKRFGPPLIILLIILMGGMFALIAFIISFLGGQSANASCLDGGPTSMAAHATSGPINVGDSFTIPGRGSLQITQERMANAQTIVSTGLSRQPPMPENGLMIALSVAIIELGLLNEQRGDRDSVGLFQQRPSQGWGTVEQIMNPVYASNKFYDALEALGNWQSMPPGEAAWKVQRPRKDLRGKYGEVMSPAAGLVQSILPALASGGLVNVSMDGTNPQCEQYAGNGGDPSDCPPDSAIPPNTFRISGSPNELCVKSVQQARSPEAGAAIIWTFHHLGIPYGRPDGVCSSNTTRTGPSHYDCSGFVTSAYKQTGTDLGGNPATSGMRAGQMKARKIDASQARPGDLYLPTTGHVVMILADDTIIHTNKCGDVSHVKKKYTGSYNTYFAPDATFNSTAPAMNNTML